ncbi:MAG: hypothetical protein H6636_07990 [Anaerolineales bacterium]|nr:hypothetical protein [Anaerolineales bacterium]
MTFRLIMHDGSKMEQEQIWQTWAEHLRRWRLGSFAAWFLDSASPVHLVGAQLVYVGQPLLEAFVSQGQVKALATILEQPAQARALAAFLREDR